MPLCSAVAKHTRLELRLHIEEPLAKARGSDRRHDRVVFPARDCVYEIVY